MYYIKQKRQLIRKTVLSLLYLSLLAGEATEFIESKPHDNHKEKNYPQDEFHLQHHLPENNLGFEVQIKPKGHLFHSIKHPTN